MELFEALEALAKSLADHLGQDIEIREYVPFSEPRTGARLTFRDGELAVEGETDPEAAAGIFRALALANVFYVSAGSGLFSQRFGPFEMCAVSHAEDFSDGSSTSAPRARLRFGLMFNGFHVDDDLSSATSREAGEALRDLMLDLTKDEAFVECSLEHEGFVLRASGKAARPGAPTGRPAFSRRASRYAAAGHGYRIDFTLHIGDEKLKEDEELFERAGEALKAAAWPPRVLLERRHIFERLSLELTLLCL